MNITINGTKHTIPDDSTHVAVESNGDVFYYALAMQYKGVSWGWCMGRLVDLVCNIPPPINPEQCLAEVSDGAVISFEGM